MTALRFISRSMLGFVLAFSAGTASGAEFRVHKANITLPLTSATTINEEDAFVRNRLSNKQLINLALGQPLKTKVAKGTIIAVLVPSAATTPLPSSLVIFNTKTKTLGRILATFSASSVLAPDEPKKPIVSLVTVSFPAFANAEIGLDPFSLTGSLIGTSITSPKATSIGLKLSGLHGEFARSPTTLFFYANVVTSAQIRASGKPVAILDL